MIVRRHEFNSEWWGGNVGVVDLQGLAESSDSDALASIQEFAWVEAKLGSNDIVTANRLKTLGFHQSDTQIAFRIRLSDIEATESLREIGAKFADEEPFKISSDEILDFSADRFSRLPGFTPEMARRRYALWGQRLVDSQPQFALRISSDGETQGFYLSRKSNSGFELTLAMLATDSKISGMHLYHRALLAYKEKGIRIGGASFSVFNTQVMNIYSKLGARFTSSESVWFKNQ